MLFALFYYYIMILELTSNLPPSVNHYLGHKIIKGRIVTYASNEAKKYKKDFSEYVISEIEKQGWNLIPNKYQHFYVDMDFYFDRIDKDAGNYDKCLLDAITETKKIWLDDNVVCPRVNKVLYDTKNPRIELKIYPVEYIGIFDNVEDLEQFKRSNCNVCCKDKCSIIDNALMGKITSDIVQKKCQKLKNNHE